MLRQETPPVAGPLQIFKCFLIHATAGPHARNCPRANIGKPIPKKPNCFVEIRQLADSLARKYVGVREWPVRRYGIYFLVRQLADWYFLFQDKKYNKKILQIIDYSGFYS